MGANRKLGLPFFSKMEKIAVCFDVDGTLIENDHRHTLTIGLLEAMTRQPWKNVDIIVWSGGGADYARTQVERVFKHDGAKYIKFFSKMDHDIVRAKYDKLIAIDDIQDTALGDVNLVVRNK